MNTKTHFDTLSAMYDSKKPKYYYETLKNLYSEIIPPGRKILDIGCGTGEMLAHLKPSYGVGIDNSEQMIKIAKQKYPQFHFFVEQAERLNISNKFDYIIMVDVIEHLNSIEKTLNQIYKISTPSTLIVASWYNPVWEPIIKTAEFFKLKMPEGPHHLITIKKLNYLLQRRGFILIAHYYRMLLPLNILGLSDIINSIAERIPFINRFLFLQVCIFQKNENRNS